MKQVTIVSGKGGTGKTSVSASLAQVVDCPVVFVDADVDAANFGILLQKGVETTPENFYSGYEATIKQEKCVGCGACMDACPFDAIELDDNTGLYSVNAFKCEGCRYCLLFCGVNAIKMKKNQAGSWQIRTINDEQSLVYAELGIAQDNSGKLVAHLRKNAAKLAEEKNRDFILIDGPPGIGCPVHAAVGQVDLVVVTVEPALSSLSDLKRLYKTVKNFNLEAAVIINKYDLNDHLTAEIEKFSSENNMEILGKLPFNKQVPEYLAQNKTPYEIPEFAEKFHKIWHKIKRKINL